MSTYKSPEVCGECGLFFCPDDLDDVKAHNEWHERLVNGIPANPVDSDRVIWNDLDERITAISDLKSTYAQKRRAEKTSRVARKAVAYADFTYHPYFIDKEHSELDHHFFLRYRKNRIIGYLSFGNRVCNLRLNWGKDTFDLNLEDSDNSRWTIDMMWVAIAHRGNNLTEHTIKIAASFLKTEV